jgi:hypothetical protein
MATLQVTIAAGTSLSDAASLSNLTFDALIAPDAWIGRAPLSFQLSADGVAFYDMSAWSTTDIFLMPVLPNSIAPISKDFPKNIWIKLHSGHPNTPIVQEADRLFTILTS